jgi:uncharacterized protein (TIGR00725 family)
MRKFQIGVIGSMADLHYSAELEQLAEKIGAIIAQKGGILVFGAEKDADSISSAACRGAHKANGITLGLTYGSDKTVHQRDVDIVIPTGSERGGGREFVLVLACDAVIALAGGSGTLNEITIAYMADIPIIALRGFAGWSDKLADQYLDERKRRKIFGVDTPEAAVDMAFRKAADRRKHNDEMG